LQGRYRIVRRLSPERLAVEVISEKTCLSKKAVQAMLVAE